MLHAGVVVAAIFLLVLGPRDQRLLGGALALGLAAKIATEAPWQDAVQWSDGWGFPVAVGSHASGALAGLACALLVLFLSWAIRDWPRR